MGGREGVSLGGEITLDYLVYILNYKLDVTLSLIKSNVVVQLDS